MESQAPLPELQQQVLDAEMLADYRNDLEQLAELLEVKTRAAAPACGMDLPVPLREALEGLQQGRFRGVQVRYRFQGRSWWDTLLTGAGGIRLTRICPEEG